MAHLSNLEAHTYGSYRVRRSPMMGTLEKTSAVKCMAGIQVASSPSAALTAAMSGGTLVKSITGTSGLKTSYAAAKALYVGSELQTLAKAKNTGTSYYDVGAARFGSATWIDDYILSGLDATGQFAGTLAASRGDMTAARDEAIKKGVQDQVLVAAMLAKLSGAKTVADLHIAYAYYTGATPGGAPWARANKRCKNYGTCGAGTSGVAKTNSHILHKFMQMEAALAVDANADISAHKAAVVSQVMIIYYQVCSSPAARQP